ASDLSTNERCEEIQGVSRAATDPWRSRCQSRLFKLSVPAIVENDYPIMSWIRQSVYNARRTSSTAPGFSNAEMSPGSLPSQAARMTRRMTFAFLVLGKSRTNLTSRGANDLPKARLTRSFSALRSASSGACPGLSTQKQTSDSPLISSGTPTAAASLTAGCPTSVDSTSAGPTRLPAILIVSSERPRIYHRPSASMAAQSPCIQVSGKRDQYVSR